METLQTNPKSQALALQPEEANLVVKKVKRLHSFDEAFDLIRQQQQTDRSFVLSFINAHGYNLACTNPAMKEALLASDLLLRDGTGMQLLFSSIKKDPGVNFCGTDFIPWLLERMQGKRVVLIGTTQPYLNNAVSKINALGHEVLWVMDGFRPFEEYLSKLNASKPDIILLGMGMPRQEELSFLLKNYLSGNPLIINGGAIIDYLGEKVKRAPVWVRRMGCEWLFRFLLEPKRMFPRYVKGNFLFLKRVYSTSKLLL